jgi:hypothetical protein
MEERDTEAVLGQLSSEEHQHLESCGYLWRRDLGVVWRDPRGRLRRAEFTHGTYFNTARGVFYINSGGHIRRVEEEPRCRPGSGV